MTKRFGQWKSWVFVAMLACSSALATTTAQAQEGDAAQSSSSETNAIDFNIDMDEFESFGQEGFSVETPLDPATEATIQAIRIGSYGIGLVGLLFSLFLAYQLASSLSAIPPTYRQLSPWVPWLIFVPLVGIVVLVLAFIKVPNSLSKYLASTGHVSQGDCGEKLGLWGAILTIIGCTAPIGLVLLLLSTLKIRQAKMVAKTLAQV